MLERLGIGLALLASTGFLIWEALGDDHRSWSLMVNIWINAIAVLLLWFLLSGRTRVVGDAYAHGYRQGREDANSALAEMQLLAMEEATADHEAEMNDWGVLPPPTRRRGERRR
jgi:hypothetical protein